MQETQRPISKEIGFSKEEKFPETPRQKRGILSPEEKKELLELRNTREELLRKKEETQDIQEKIRISEKVIELDKQIIPIKQTIEAREKEERWLGIMDREKKAWEEMLGYELKPESLPDFLTPELIEKLSRYGFKIYWEPGLMRNSQNYILFEPYPGLREFDSLSRDEKKDHSIPRWLPKKFLDTMRDAYVMQEAQAGSRVEALFRETREQRRQILKGNAVGDVSEYPSHSGNWAAVETLPKPNQGEDYEETPLASILGIKDRFGLSAQELQQLIRAKEEGILASLGLTKDQAEVKLLPAVSYNLFANRFGWGATSSNEWVDTRGVDASSGRQFTFAMGHSEHGGAGAMVRKNLEDSSPEIGFRLAIYFRSQESKA